MATRQQQQIEAQQQILVAKVILSSFIGAVDSALHSGDQAQLSGGGCCALCEELRIQCCLNDIKLLYAKISGTK